MKRAALTLCLGCGLLWAAEPAPAGTIRDSVSAVAFSGASGSSLGTLMFYDPARDLAGGDAGAPYGPGDRSWAERCLEIYDLYRQLGGEKPEGRLLFRRDGERYYIAVGGAPGSWSASADAALAQLLRALMRQSSAVPESLVQAIRTAPDGLSLGELAAALDAAPAPIVLAPGRRDRIALAGADIAVGTKGLSVGNQSPTDGGIKADISVASGTKPGRETVLGFESGRRFRAIAEQSVTVSDMAVAGPAEPVTPPETVSEQTVRPGESHAGTIASGGSVIRYRVPVSESGRLSVSSSGPSDLIATLKAPDGAVVVSDDDSGGGYNFAFEAEVEAGEYVLEVRHCCAGTGPFSVKIGTP